MKILFVDACPRARGVSRSYELGRAFMNAYVNLHPDADVTEYRLNDMDLRPLTGEQEKARGEMTLEQKLSDPALQPARDFALADMIVVCAPYWDFAFPACLKAFIERVCVYDITFRYEADLPVGLCRAENLVYLTSAGSPIGNDNWGGDYLKAVTGKLLGVKKFHQVTADGLDLAGADIRAIMDKAVLRAQELASRI